RASVPEATEQPSDENERDGAAISADERPEHEFYARNQALPIENAGFQALAEFERKRVAAPLSQERRQLPVPVQTRSLPPKNRQEEPDFVRARGGRDHSPIHAVFFQIRSYSYACSLSASRKLLRARQRRVSTA